MTKTWTAAELRSELDRFEAELQDAQLSRNTVSTYVERTRIFLRWLEGDYRPRGPVGSA
jgi:hypothetical protein